MAATEKTKLLRKRAAAAACTLLGIPASAKAAAGKPTLPVDSSAEASAEADRWTLDNSLLYYSEAERIAVVEPQIAARRDFSDNRSLNIMVTVDSITGATPLGTLPATPKTAPNTVTGASGRNTNPIVGKIPLSNMTDTRYALGTTWQQPLGSAYTGVIGADASKETDYISLGANTKVAREFNEKNTTLSLGVAPEFDISNPNGGLPVPYSTEFAAGSIDGTRDTKVLLSGLAGITQVINRRTLMQFNYGLTQEHGDLNDPYKLLSLTDNQGNPISAIYENRPHKRTEQSLYWLLKHNIWDQDVVSLSFRYYSDDWGIRSQTFDFTFHRQSSDRFFWEPRVRYYHQSAADFYYAGLLSGQPLPQFASADLRLANFDGITFGVRFGYTLQNGSLLIVRADYYTQTGESHPPSAVGAQQSYDLFPTLYATILQVEYQFDPARLFAKKMITLERDSYVAGRFEAMNCPCEILLDTTDSALGAEQLDTARREAQRIEKKYSRYLDGNIVHRINTSGGKKVKVDKETASLLDYAAECFEMSGGLFDITRRGWDQVTWKSPFIQVPPGFEVDFGGICKEYAADRILSLLKKGRDLSTLVNLGGDIAAAGQRRWSVGIEDFSRPGKMLQTVHFRQGGIATSGTTKRPGHILNPKTGHPIENAPRSVTVAAKTCTEAGFWSTLAILNGAQAETFLKGQSLEFWCYR